MKQEYKRHYSAIYLSPHLDDIALSCGGQVRARTRAGEKVLIVTMTTGNPSLDALPPFAQSHHGSWAVGADAVTVRRIEDIESCRWLGADYLHWPILDCIYRRDPVSGAPLYQSDDEIFGPVNPAESGLVAELVAACQALPTADQIFAPLTEGNHVDHQLLRQAAEQAFGTRLRYYEDFPYVAWHNFAGVEQWQSQTVPVAVADLVAKFASIVAHRSQMPHLFGSEAEMEKLVRDYMDKVGGERIWFPPT